MEYAGPLRDEPLAVELHNTLYASRGAALDGLAGDRAVRTWLEAVAERLPEQARGAEPDPDELRALRGRVRAALQATLERRRVPGAALDALNAVAAAAPRCVLAGRAGAVELRRNDAFPGCSPDAILLGALAGSAIELITGPQRARLRACGAPGCVLIFVKEHPRRQWCSAACGNRARQARHYARQRSRPPAQRRRAAP